MVLNNIFYIASIILISLVVIFVCRELACWYWKQNHILSTLEEVRDLLKRLTPEKSPEKPSQTQDIPEIPKHPDIKEADDGGAFVNFGTGKK